MDLTTFLDQNDNFAIDVIYDSFAQRDHKRTVIATWIQTHLDWLQIALGTG